MKFIIGIFFVMTIISSMFFININVLQAQTASRNQQICASREQFSTKLKEYGEKRIAIGLDHNGRLMEIYRSPDTAAFTIIITDPNTTACLAISGTSLEFIREFKEKFGTSY